MASDLRATSVVVISADDLRKIVREEIARDRRVQDDLARLRAAGHDPHEAGQGLLECRRCLCKATASAFTRLSNGVGVTTTDMTMIMGECPGDRASG